MTTSLVKNIFTHALANYIVAPVSLVSAIILRRWLDPDIIGIISILNLILLWSTFINLGSYTYLEIRLPYLRGVKDEIKIKYETSNAFIFSNIASFIFIAITYLWLYFHGEDLRSELVCGVILYVFYCWLNQIYSFYVTLLRSRSEFILLSKIQLLSIILTNVSNIVFVYFLGFNGFLISTVLAAIIQLSAISRLVKFDLTRKFKFMAAYDLITKGAPLLIIGITNLLLKSIDGIIVANYFNEIDVGYYSIILMSAGFVFSFSNSIGNVLFPALQEAKGNNPSVSHIQSYILIPLEIASFLTPIIISFMYYFMPVIIHDLIPKYASALPSFAISLHFSYFFSIVSILNGFLLSEKKSGLYIAINIITAVSIFIVFLLSSENYDVHDLKRVSISTGIGYVIYFSLIFYFVLQSEKLRLILLKYIQALFPILCCVFINISINMFFRDLKINEWLGFLIKFPLFLLIYMSIFLSFEKNRILARKIFSRLYVVLFSNKYTI